MLGIIVWCIIFIVIAVCILPWWFFPVTVGYFLLIECLRNTNFSKPRKSKRQDSMPHLEKVKREIEQQKKAKINNVKNKTASKTNANSNRTNANISAGTYYQKNDNYNYDKNIAAKREEQAAYDDYIASLDMDD